MSVFTDDNLRIVKNVKLTMTEAIFFTHSELEALIARLEAAEYALNNAPKADYYDDVFVDAVEQWLKAAGK